MHVALASTTLGGEMLFGCNAGRPRDEGQALCMYPAKPHAPGETLALNSTVLPQVRQTHAILGFPAGAWGVRCGVNEFGVSAACGPLETRMPDGGAVLTGPDLVRLALERSRSARQARDVIVDHVSRQGVTATGGEPPCGMFLVADRHEAFVLETAGKHWAEQEAHAVRAVSDVVHLRQDWNRISRGLAEWAIARGWWPEDGSKLDFAAVVSPHAGEGAGLRRWGRATLFLEQRSGQLERTALRRLLGDHFDDLTVQPLANFATGYGEPALCDHGSALTMPTALSALIEVPAATRPLPILWCAFGPPCTSVFFPIVLAGELPAALRPSGPENGCEVWRSMRQLIASCQHDPMRWRQVRDEMTRLQTRFEEKSRDLLLDAAPLYEANQVGELARLVNSFTQHLMECFDEACANLNATAGLAGPKRPGTASNARHAAQERPLPTF